MNYENVQLLYHSTVRPLLSLPPTLFQSGELLFIDMDKCKQETSATRVAEYNGLRDQDQTGWASQTCVLGWSVLGIWPPGADGECVCERESVCVRERERESVYVCVTVCV